MLKTMHKNCISSQSCKFVTNYFSKIKFFHAHVQCVCIVMAKYQMAPAKNCGRSWSAHLATTIPVKENAHETLSMFSQLFFCQKLFFHYQTTSNVKHVSIVFVKFQSYSWKTVVEIDRPVKALYSCTYANKHSH